MNSQRSCAIFTVDKYAFGGKEFSIYVDVYAPFPEGVYFEVVAIPLYED